jgi:hypothetical protein
MGGPRLHALIKLGLLVRKSVFALREIFGHFCSFAIALEAETDVFTVLSNHQHVSLEARIDLRLGLIFVALGVPLKGVTVNQVIAGMQVVAPGGRSLGGGHAAKRDNGRHSKSGAWAGATQLFLALDKVTSEIFQSRRG